MELRSCCSSIDKLSKVLHLDIEADYKVLEHISKHAKALNVHSAIHRVIVSTDQLTLEICAKSLASVINENLGTVVNSEAGLYNLTIPYYTKRARRGAVIIRNGDGKDPLDLPKNKLRSLIKGIIWRDEHFNGMTILDIAKREGCTDGFVNRLIRNTFKLI